MKTGIIIKETEAASGLKTVYYTNGLKDLIQSLEFQIGDERMLDFKLANNENYFVVENSKSAYKFYRYVISTGIIDSFGRPGYYSINIVVQLKNEQQIVNINEPCELLKNIELLYRELRVLDNPDYKQFDELANSIKVIPNDYQYIDTPAKNILFQKIDIQSNISIQLNNIAAIGVQKICFFSRNAVDDSHFQQNKYEQLASDSSNYLRQISVENRFNESFALEVNDKTYKLSNVSGFYVNPQSNLSYKLQGESKQAIFGNRIKIERKILSKPISRGGSDTRKPNNPWLYVTSGVFVVGILSFFAFKYSGNEKELKVNTVNSGAINETEPVDKTVTIEYFEIVGDSILRLKNDFISNTNRVKLPKSFIMFKGEENKIYFRNGFSQNKDVEYDSLKFEDFNLTVFDNSEEAEKVDKILFHKELKAKIEKLRSFKVIQEDVIKAEPVKNEKPKRKETEKKVKPVDRSEREPD